MVIDQFKQQTQDQTREKADTDGQTDACQLQCSLSNVIGVRPEFKFIASIITLVDGIENSRQDATENAWQDVTVEVSQGYHHTIFIKFPELGRLVEWADKAHNIPTRQRNAGIGVKVTGGTIYDTTLNKSKITARAPKMRSWANIFRYVRAEAVNEPRMPATSAKYILSTAE